LELFYVSLINQGIEAAYIDWRPPAEGDEEMIDILDKLI
jgi:hypothetical protein